MAENEYSSIKITKETYEQLRELKYLTKQSFIDIIQECVDEKHKEVKRKKKMDEKSKEE